VPAPQRRKLLACTTRSDGRPLRARVGRMGRPAVVSSGKSRVVEGAISVPIHGPARVVRRGGQVIDVPPGGALRADECER